VLKHHGSYQQQNRDLQVSTNISTHISANISSNISSNIYTHTQGGEGFEGCLEGFGVRG